MYKKRYNSKYAKVDLCKNRYNSNLKNYKREITKKRIVKKELQRQIINNENY